MEAVLRRVCAPAVAAATPSIDERSAVDDVKPPCLAHQRRQSDLPWITQASQLTALAHACGDKSDHLSQCLGVVATA